MVDILLDVSIMESKEDWGLSIYLSITSNKIAYWISLIFIDITMYAVLYSSILLVTAI